MPKVGGRRVFIILSRKKSGPIARSMSNYKNNCPGFLWSRRETAPRSWRKPSMISESASTPTLPSNYKTAPKSPLKPTSKRPDSSMSPTWWPSSTTTIVKLVINRKFPQNNQTWRWIDALQNSKLLQNERCPASWRATFQHDL